MPILGAFGVVTHGHSLVDRGIELVTGSVAYHAFIYVSGTQVIEARPNGAGYADIYPDAVWSKMPLTASQSQLIVANAVKLIGTKYSWLDDAAIGIAKLQHHNIPAVIRKRLSRPDRLMCSQLVDEVYNRAGIELMHGRWPGDVAPSDLLNIIMAQHAGA